MYAKNIVRRKKTENKIKLLNNIQCFSNIAEEWNEISAKAMVKENYVELISRL